VLSAELEEMKRTISTNAAPQAIGPYSQAVRAGQWLFCSGQIGLDPVTGEIVSGGVIAEAGRVLENLRAVLAAAGGSLDDVVRTTIYLVDLADFGRVNEIYAQFFNAPFPARAAFSTLPERMQRVQARMRLTEPFTLARTRCKFGRHIRLVRLFA
jgi:2-iminobutanoate/2-iminopropanoate deaminase